MQEQREEGPVLVGHPMTALERELRRLVVREELEKDQLKIVRETGLDSKDARDKLLQLYELYETFKNADNTCVSGTDTKYNLYNLYREVFKTKRAIPPHSPVHTTVKKWRGKDRAATAVPRLQKQATRASGISGTSPQVPVVSSFPQPRGTAAPAPAAVPNIPTTPRRTQPRPPRQTLRPHSAPADFSYNKLYTANRCYTTRRICERCSATCTCVVCSPMERTPTPQWRDITCALTPDTNQIEAHWAEMSPLIQSHLMASNEMAPTTTRKQKRKKGKKETGAATATATIQDDAKSTGSKMEVQKPIAKQSRGNAAAAAAPAAPQQAWTAEKQVKPKKKKEAKKAAVSRQQRQYQYQRTRSRTNKRYRWEKVESDSESSDGGGGEQSDGAPEEVPAGESVVHRGRLLRERKRHKWGDYQAVLTARALYLYNREFDSRPREVLPLWGTKLSINADKTDLQYSFILKTPSTNKNKALLKMSCLTETEMRTWLTKIREAMKLNMEMTSELARNKKSSVFGELPEHPSWSHEGYRIDVSYISDTIIVCSFPPTRSDVYELKRFMDDKHKGCYKIINVCEKSYDSTMFGDNVHSYPTPNNSVARLSHLWDFCEFVDQWLKEDDGNVVVVHCQTGTSVSGLFVSAYLLHSRICWTSEQAIKQFRQKRENGIISLPCQTRYLKYIESSVIAGERPEDIQLLLSSITLSNSPAFNEDGSCKPYFVIFQNGEEIFEKESSDSYKTEEPISFPVSVHISGDIKVQFFSVSDILGTQEMFTVHFHTFYIASSHVRFSREMIDGAHINTFKQFTESFSVSVELK